MNRYYIIADNVELDTNDDIDVSLNYQIDDIMNIEKRKTDFSKTLTLPGTPKNNIFFKNIFDVQIDSQNFNVAKSIKCHIRCGDNTVMRGYLQLLDIVIDNKEVEYQVSVSGSIKNILNDLADYTMRNLDLSEYNHIRNRTNIAKSWSYTVKSYGSDLIMSGPGRGYVYPYIVTGDTTNIMYRWNIYDAYPAPYIKTLWDKMFEFAGFTYTSKFINSEYFKKLIFPYTEDKIEKSAEQVDLETTRIGSNTTSYTTLVPLRNRGSSWWKNYTDIANYFPLFRESGTVTDNGNDLEFQDGLNSWQQNANGGIYVCQSAGYYDVAFTGKVFPYVVHVNGKTDMELKEGQFKYLYRLKKNGQILDASYNGSGVAGANGLVNYFGLSSGTHASPWIDLGTQVFFDVSADNVYLNVGDVIRIDIGFEYGNDVKWYGSSDDKHKVGLLLKQSYNGSFTKLTVTPSSNQSMGNDEIDLTATLSDKLKMKDFFLSIVQMFNLIVMDNPNKENDLIIEPRDDFFNSKQRVRDWTYKIDNDSDIKISPMSELDAKAYRYTYTKDEDFYNKEYTDETGKVYGEYQIDVINDFSDVIKKTELIFAPTPDAEKYINPGSVGRVAPFFVEKSDEDFKAKKVKPRILFYSGLQPTDKTFLLQDSPVGHNTTYYEYPYCGMWDLPYDATESLEFGWSDKVYWTSNSVPVNNLYNKFHKATMNNIIDINARLMECKIHLTPKEIADFDFRDIIFFQDKGYWRVNKIKDFNPVGSDSLTTVILYKLNNLKIYDGGKVEVPTSTQHCPDDIVAVRNIKPYTNSVSVSLSSKKFLSQPKDKGYYISLSGKPITEDCCKSVGGYWVNGMCRIRTISDPGPVGPVKPYTGGLPTVEPVANDLKRNQNNSIMNGVKMSGRENYAQLESDVKLIIGNNNSAAKGATGSIIIGDNINADEPGAVYLGEIKISQDGNITNTGISIIDGGEDVVFPFDKTNLIDIIDGGIDSVRNPGGSSKSRPIIDGNNLE